MQALGMRGVVASAGNFVSVAWSTANLAFYAPMQIPFNYPVKNMFWYNGATIAGNVDCGVFTHDLTKICSVGSTAQSGATALQFAAPTSEVILTPGNYYFALVSSSTTATFFTNNLGTATRHRYVGEFQQASALPLPAAATIAATATARIPLIGITYKTGTPSF